MFDVEIFFIFLIWLVVSRPKFLNGTLNLKFGWTGASKILREKKIPDILYDVSPDHSSMVRTFSKKKIRADETQPQCPTNFPTVRYPISQSNRITIRGVIAWDLRVVYAMKQEFGRWPLRCGTAALRRCGAAAGRSFLQQLPCTAMGNVWLQI